MRECNKLNKRCATTKTTKINLHTKGKLFQLNNLFVRVCVRETVRQCVRA